MVPMHHEDTLEGSDFPPNPQDGRGVASTAISGQNRNPWVWVAAASGLSLPSTAAPHPGPEIPVLGGGGSVSLMSFTSVVSKGSGSFAGCLSLGNFQVAAFEGHWFPYRSVMQKDFFTEGFL